MQPALCARLAYHGHELLGLSAVVKVLFSPSAHGTYFELLCLDAYVTKVRLLGFEEGSILSLHVLGFWYASCSKTLELDMCRS